MLSGSYCQIRLFTFYGSILISVSSVRYKGYFFYQSQIQKKTQLVFCHNSSLNLHDVMTMNSLLYQTVPEVSILPFHFLVNAHKLLKLLEHFQHFLREALRPQDTNQLYAFPFCYLIFLSVSIVHNNLLGVCSFSSCIDWII